MTPQMIKVAGSYISLYEIILKKSLSRDNPKNLGDFIERHKTLESNGKFEEAKA